MSVNDLRLSERLPVAHMPLREVAELLNLDPSKASGLVRSGRFPCSVRKVRGRYAVSVADVMKAMGIEDPVIRTADLLAGAEFAERWD
ncbi:helix-turn-helix domain-containing protein [Streptomyces sp. NPDC021096]|uniref:helix-turn-helix domain-containing protein n=1 Tax=Streptomyces sp. NPDC021096 TaxID=3154792 RepID=UPI0033E80FAD